MRPVHRYAGNEHRAFGNLRIGNSSTRLTQDQQSIYRICLEVSALDVRTLDPDLVASAQDVLAQNITRRTVGTDTVSLLLISTAH